MFLYQCHNDGKTNMTNQEASSTTIDQVSLEQYLIYDLVGFGS